MYSDLYTQNHLVAGLLPANHCLSNYPLGSSTGIPLTWACSMWWPVDCCISMWCLGCHATRYPQDFFHTNQQGGMKRIHKTWVGALTQVLKVQASCTCRRGGCSWKQQQQQRILHPTPRGGNIITNLEIPAVITRGENVSCRLNSCLFLNQG